MRGTDKKAAEEQSKNCSRTEDGKKGGHFGTVVEERLRRKLEARGKVPKKELRQSFGWCLRILHCSG